MGRRELGQAPFAERGQPDADDTAVAGVVDAPDQPCGERPVHKLDRTVMPLQQVPGEIADCRRLAAWVPFDGDQN